MIAVIADDITGAAEIAGIGFDYGLKVILTQSIETEIAPCDVLVCITNTRSMRRDDAINESLRVGKRLTQIGVEHIFKKTDSVLRGHVAAELKALMDATGKTSALLLPANPALGRQIIDGIYYVNKVPITQTSFSYDPEFPAKSDEAIKLLGEGILINPHETLPTSDCSIAIGNIATEEDFIDYCKLLNNTLLPAGGGSFFKAFLKQQFPHALFKQIEKKIKLGKLLLICGSTIKHNALLCELEAAKVPIESMPTEVYHGEVSSEKWIEYLNTQYALHGNLVVIINQPISHDPAYAMRLKQIMAKVCQSVVSQHAVKELIIEGGATAYEVISAMQWQAFEVVGIMTTGVIKLKPQNSTELQLTLKPGSYQWPEEVLIL